MPENKSGKQLAPEVVAVVQETVNELKAAKAASEHAEAMAGAALASLNRIMRACSLSIEDVNATLGYQFLARKQEEGAGNEKKG